MIPTPVLYLVFLASGFSALLYQVVWQRVLFTIYGTNIESITVVVTAFMLGLGLGSLLGGRISRIPARPLLILFGAFELGIGAYGVISLPLFAWVGGATAGIGVAATGFLALLLVLLPTLGMGATLPMLVAHFVGRSGHVGDAVARLYCINTLGAAAGALGGVLFLLRHLGLAQTTLVAAALNGVVGLSVLALAARKRKADR